MHSDDVFNVHQERERERPKSGMVCMLLDLYGVLKISRKDVHFFYILLQTIKPIGGSTCEETL